MGELAGGGSVTVAVGCWPRREGWGLRGKRRGFRRGGKGVAGKIFVLCSTTSSINFKYLI